MRKPVLLADVPQHIRDRIIREAAGRPAVECWEPIGRPQREGYWYLDWSIGGGKTRSGRIHRLAYQVLVGEIPDGHNLHHTCRNRSCWNPRHLTPETWEDHGRDHAANQTTCRKGLHVWPESAVRMGGDLHCGPCRDQWKIAGGSVPLEPRPGTGPLASRAVRRTVAFRTASLGPDEGGK